MTEESVATGLRRGLHLSYPLFAAIGIGCGSSVLVLTLFNYLLGPIGEELRLSRPQVSAALSIYLGVLIFSLPLAGAIADRIGARLTALVSTLGFAACLFWASRAGSAPELYLAFGAAAALGAGASPITYNRAVVSRFVKHRGLALGIGLSGGGAAAMILPRIIRPIAVDDGWREAMLVMAVMALAPGLLAGAFSGEPNRGSAKAARADVGGYGLRQAVTTRAFLIMCLAFGALGATFAAATSHLTQIWEAFRIDPAQVPQFQLVGGAATIFGRIVGGWLMDRMPAKLVGAGAAFAGAAGFLLLAYANQAPAAVLLAAVLIGFCTGSESDVVSFLTGQFFGVRRFARIYGILASTFMAGAAAGPITMSAAAEKAPFSWLLAVCAALLVLSGLLLLTLKAPPRIWEQAPEPEAP